MLGFGKKARRGYSVQKILTCSKDASAARREMGFYSKYLLPHLLDLAMRNREQNRLRREWVPRARGDVLEIGIGSGLNLPFYSADIFQVRGLDCSPELL